MRTMSLRFQISYRVLVLSVCIMLLGGMIAIWQARNAVNKEVESSFNLVLQLVNLGLPDSKIDEAGWRSRLNGLKQARHLDIQLKTPSGQMVQISENKQQKKMAERPPQWFINLVSHDYPKAEYPIKTSDGKSLTLVIRANPIDEISEVWQESITFFTVVSLLVSLTFIAVQLVFNRTFRDIETIVGALKLIETGEYRQKLPEFSTQEYDSIARAINHMTDVLEEAQEKNQALTQHSLKIQEEERQRLSQELHDELGQSLTAIKVMSATANHQNADVPELMKSITEICDHLMKVVRSMMQQLHPLILTELGLKATLDDLISHWRQRHFGVDVSLVCDDCVDRLDESVAIQIYRVVQECLTNISRHASANHVEIALTMPEQETAEDLKIVIKDDGEGCNSARLSAGFGLLSMKERIKSLGGRLTLQSAPGKGFNINICIPVG